MDDGTDPRYSSEQDMLEVIEGLRFLHKDKLEPAFIKRYRENLYKIMDEDAEWDRTINAIVRLTRVARSKRS